MRGRYWYALLTMLATLAPPASALQLRWSTGSTDIAFTSAARCTLVVQADPGENRLPSEWRLIWVADSASVTFAAVNLADACTHDEAQVSGVDYAATRADSAAHLMTAHFCSVDNSAAMAALQIVDLPAAARAKFKVIALDPNDLDSTRVIESAQVTTNGGLFAAYPPAVLHASSVHQSLRLQVTAVGAGLSSAKSLSIAAADGSWALPLAVVSQSNSTMAGVASVAASLPACEANVAASDGASFTAPLQADPDPQLELPTGGGCSAQYFEELLLSPPSPLGFEVQPKDFSFTPGFVDQTTNRYALHLFYIRHNYWYYQPPDSQIKWHPELDEKNFGHAWTSDFVSWHGPAAGDKTDTTGITVRAGKFDELHVWAPTIIRKSNGDPTFYMFYTGVRNEGGKENQRIGVATSTDLNTWTQADTTVLSADKIQWVNTNPSSHYNGSQQLRDPFVMEYPAGSGRYIMYFVAVDDSSGTAEDMAVGAALSTDLRTWTPIRKPIPATKLPTFQGHTHIVESPHVFKHNGQWWMPYTVGQDKVFFETTTSADPSDTLAVWSSPVWLRGVSQGRPAEMQYWHASEHLQFSNSSYEWLAAFDDNAISIDIKGVYATDSTGVDSLLLDCPPKSPIAGVGDPHGLPTQLQLDVVRPRLGASGVTLRLGLPWRTQVRLGVYDVAGRRLTTLVDRELPAGVTNVRWDGAGGGGGHVPSGVYFVRLNCAHGARASKVVMLR